MVKIRLRRMGRNKKPSYRVVVADSKSPRDGAFIQNLGYYNPLTNPPTVVLDNVIPNPKNLLTTCGVVIYTKNVFIKILVIGKFFQKLCLTGLIKGGNLYSGFRKTKLLQILEKLKVIGKFFQKLR